VYTPRGSLFPIQKGKELYKTSGYKEISIIYGTTESSYRETSALINRIRYQEGATPERTVADNTEREGEKIRAFIEKKTQEILVERHFTDKNITMMREA
jgi:hypothetical protein